jgi:hypothetical protein
MYRFANSQRLSGNPFSFHGFETALFSHVASIRARHEARSGQDSAL